MKALHYETKYPFRVSISGSVIQGNLDNKDYFNP